MLTSRTTPKPRRRRATGFTLNEVMIAMGILAVGITSVASLFPAAMILQREAAKDTLRQQNVRSAESILRAKTISAQQLFDFTDNIASFNNSNATGPRSGGDLEFEIYALAEIDTDYNPALETAGPGSGVPAYYDTDMQHDGAYSTNTTYNDTNSLLRFWPVEDRSFPTYQAEVRLREIFTVPVFRRGVQATPYINDWVVYVMVMQSRDEERRHFPNTYDVGPTSAPGDLICANPFDHAFTADFLNGFRVDRYPKVFRVPIRSLPNGQYRVEGGSLSWTSPGMNGSVVVLRPGDMVLGSDGDVYRIGRLIDLNTFTINREGRQAEDDDLTDLDLDALWVCPPGFTEDDEPATSSPIEDVRILSRGVVTMGVFQ